MSEYPLSMTHPHYRKGTFAPITGVDQSSGRHFTDYQGTPDIFPPVTVNNEDQEEYHRAKGYMAAGEGPAAMSYQEFPMWMTKDGYENVLVHNERDKATRLDLGYAAPGTPDPDAVATAAASPYVPGAVVQEFPKVVGGAIVDPRPAEGGFQRYPMWIGDKLVQSAAEERALLGATDEDVTEMEHLEAANQIDQKLALIAEAERRGIKIDKRWNTSKLQQAVG